MTPAELREGVAREICRMFRWDWGGLDDAGKEECFAFSDAALAVVREAMREPDAGMMDATAKVDDQAFAWGNAHGADFETLWAVAIAASPLRDAP